MRCARCCSTCTYYIKRNNLYINQPLLEFTVNSSLCYFPYPLHLLQRWELPPTHVPCTLESVGGRFGHGNVSAKDCLVDHTRREEGTEWGGMVLVAEVKPATGETTNIRVSIEGLLRLASLPLVPLLVPSHLRQSSSSSSLTFLNTLPTLAILQGTPSSLRSPL